MSVDGAVVLVTGGAGGIGAAAARMFARDGAEAVVIADVKDASGTVAAVQAAGVTASWVDADVAEEDVVVDLIAGIVAEHGRLDTAFNNAGITGHMTTFHELDKATWDRMIAVNLSSVFLCMKHELAHMVERGGGGAIVNTSSGAGVFGFAGLPHYVAAKHGVLGLTRTAASEYASLGIRVNAVLPGPTETPMLLSFMGDDDGLRRLMASSVPSGELLQPEDIAEAVVWLASDKARQVSGQAHMIDGGSIHSR
jgi:NAD(P)-dependent dehydrogenase (short-subunit alcohol dehydrogenase family)